MLLERDAPGDRRRAGALLDNAIEIADQLGMQRLAAQARACRHTASSSSSF